MFVKVRGDKQVKPIKGGLRRLFGLNAAKGDWSFGQVQ